MSKLQHLLRKAERSLSVLSYLTTFLRSLLSPSPLKNQKTSSSTPTLKNPENSGEKSESA